MTEQKPSASVALVAELHRRQNEMYSAVLSMRSQLKQHEECGQVEPYGTDPPRTLPSSHAGGGPRTPDTWIMIEDDC